MYRTIAAVLAGLASNACEKTMSSAATEVPAAADDAADASGSETAGEHACGTHAEGICAGDAADAPSSRSFAIAPGEFAEANFRMTKGSMVTVAFSRGSFAIAWDVHSHDHAGGTKIHDEGKGGAGTIEFTAPSDGVFSVLWKNTGTEATPLDATVTLSDGAAIHSWMPAEAVEEREPR